MNQSQASALPLEPVFPLGLLRMSGSYALTDAAIDATLTRASPGNYALGYMEGDTFSVFYVGRSDSDVRHDLHDWVGAPSKFERFASAAKAPWGCRPGRGGPLGSPHCDPVGSCVDSSYTHFAFSYADSADAAFQKECRNYDDFGRSSGLDNRAQPLAPSATAARRGVVLQALNLGFGEPVGRRSLA